MEEAHPPFDQGQKEPVNRSRVVIGSGPIVIGQGCEFDYSGVQACKALREEGYEVVLINSNPATIMTDPEFAFRTYIEPITPEMVEKIIIKIEKPDVLLPTLGGQTALNCAMSLHGCGTLEKHGVRMIGAKRRPSRRARTAQVQKRDAQDRPRPAAVRRGAHDGGSPRDRRSDRHLPLIIRPAYTLGGTGGGIAYNKEEFETITASGLDLSPVTEVLIEESLLGWKEFEMEVIRDKADNCVIICSIENLDPMGVHTGDSITVAPIQTLTDREYQIMRDFSFACIREIGVETGGSNIQFAVHPDTGRMIVIEMNPRVSRSSALASKATGFPIAKIAAKLAVGYTLDELKNDITRHTPAAFEPTIDYVVTKIPRFTFEKFPGANETLTTQMKSVGEAMAIGRTFKESLQKALRSLEIKRFGLIGDGADKEVDDETLTTKLTVPNAERIFFLGQAFAKGWDVEKVFSLTKIDRWFLRQLEEIVKEQKDISVSANVMAKFGTPDVLKSDSEQAERMKGLSAATNWLQRPSVGSSSRRCQSRSFAVARKNVGIIPTYRLVDTCAAEFEAFTPYYYSTYGIEDEVRDNDRKKVMILGGGPNRIGQGIEFDYCCVHASFALRELGYETIMVNSNPETVSTDYDTSDKLYFEPLTLEDVLNIYERENVNDQVLGVIVQFGGQTPLNLAKGLEENGVRIIGTSPKNIELAEDRKMFAKLLDDLGLHQAPSGTATSLEEALAITAKIGYPSLVRPSFVLGGRAMQIGPEMRSTGEVMGADRSLPVAFAKAQMAAGLPLPQSGKVFLSVREGDKDDAVEVARSLVAMGFTVMTTSGTHAHLKNYSVDTTLIRKLSEGARPSILDLIRNGEISLIINTPTKKGGHTDEGKIRAQAVRCGVPMITTMSGAKAALVAITALKSGAWHVFATQDYFPHLARPRVERKPVTETFRLERVTVGV
jgi:carbamoyl-phosphate synthase large subunit